MPFQRRLFGLACWLGRFAGVCATGTRSTPRRAFGAQNLFTGRIFDGCTRQSAFALLLTKVTKPENVEIYRWEMKKCKRTISAMVGKGSVNHNSRKFRAENVDGTRTHLNIDYCNENIKTVYHELFDEALERYNAKQIRSDRKIKDYYEKIRSSKQEKPFHEIILQVGGKGNMNADTENGELAKQILDEYYQGFQERNPQLRVFSAHLHMDEATPHLHIDFVPFTTGSKRGLDTRVSLKQALATQGFKGGSRGDTEWSQWIQSEKEQLAAVMERYGIEWEHLGTHEKHLSVLDYKKQEREKEVAALGAKIEQKQIEFDVLSERVLNYDKAKDELSNLEIELDTAPKYQLPEPEKFMTAKAYKPKWQSRL